MLSSRSVEYSRGASSRIPRRIARAKLYPRRRKRNGRVRNENGACVGRGRYSALRKDGNRRKRNGGRTCFPSFRAFRAVDSARRISFETRRLYAGKAERRGRADLSENHAGTGENRFFRSGKNGERKDPCHEPRSRGVCLFKRRGGEFLSCRNHRRGRADGRGKIGESG